MKAGIYECDDGIHRTVAARETGRKVKARIKGYHQLRPQAASCSTGITYGVPTRHSPDAGGGLPMSAPICVYCCMRLACGMWRHSLLRRPAAEVTGGDRCII